VGGFHHGPHRRPAARRLHRVQLLVAQRRPLHQRADLLRVVARDRDGGVRRRQGGVGARPGGAVLHQRDVPVIDSRQDCMRYGKPELESILRCPPLRRRRLPPPRPPQVHGLRRGLRRAQSHAVAHVPPIQGTTSTVLREPINAHWDNDEPALWHAGGAPAGD
jgi:hypothetical protein